MHPPTILGVTAMMLGVLGPLLMLARGRVPGSEALGWWGAAMMVGAAGLVLGAMRSLLPALVHDNVSNALLVLATALSWSAARVFVGRTPSPVGILLGPLTTLLLPQVSPLLVKIGVAAACLAGAAYTLMAAAELWGGRDEDLPSRKAAYLLLLLHGALYLGAGILALAGSGNPQRGLPDSAQSALIVEALLHTTAMAFVLLAMTKERAEYRSTRSLMAARDAAVSVSEAKSRFLARMSHEVRTPLNAVLGLAQVLASDERLAPAQREQALTLEQAGRHLLSIVNDVLDLAKIEAGKLHLQARSFAVPGLAEGCLSLLRAMADAKRIELRLEIDPGAPAFVEGDETRVRQVLLNLLSNAIKFSPAASIVTIRIRNAARGAGLRMEIVDQGPGVPPEKRRLLFQDFVQLDPDRAHIIGGSGLGLAISAALLNAMGGRIGYEPGPDGRGSTFWIEAPLRASGAAEPGDQPDASFGPAATVSGRVLVVDDVLSNQLLTRAMLEGAGYEVELTGSGVEAIEIVARGGIDLVLMDVRMPEIDGVEATRRIRALPPPAGETAIVALTADVLEEQVHACLAAGMNGHVSKPVDRGALLAQVARALTGRASSGPSS